MNNNGTNKVSKIALLTTLVALITVAGAFITTGRVMESKADKVEMYAIQVEISAIRTKVDSGAIDRKNLLDSLRRLEDKLDRLIERTK